MEPKSSLDEIPPLWNSFGISRRSYLSLAKFSNAVEDRFGVETIAIEKVKLGSGAIVELASGDWTYHLKVERGGMVLGRTNKEGHREKLFEGSVAVENQWLRLVEVVEQSERSKVRV